MSTKKMETRIPSAHSLPSFPGARGVKVHDSPLFQLRSDQNSRGMAVLHARSPYERTIDNWLSDARCLSLNAHKRSLGVHNMGYFCEAQVFIVLTQIKHMRESQVNINS